MTWRLGTVVASHTLIFLENVHLKLKIRFRSRNVLMPTMPRKTTIWKTNRAQVGKIRCVEWFLFEWSFWAYSHFKGYEKVSFTTFLLRVYIHVESLWCLLIDDSFVTLITTSVYGSNFKLQNFHLQVKWQSTMKGFTMTRIKYNLCWPNWTHSFSATTWLHKPSKSNHIWREKKKESIPFPTSISDKLQLKMFLA